MSIPPIQQGPRYDPQIPGEPYYDPSARLQGRVLTPAICLLVCTIVGLLTSLAMTSAYSMQYATGRDTMPSRSGLRQLIMADPEFVRKRALSNLVFCGVSAIFQFVILIGVIQMMRLKSYGLALTANVISVIPCLSPCCVLGIPFGIWGLVVLNDSQIRNTFQ